MHKMNPIPMILDTDWWTDCDDVLAVRLAAYYHRLGRIRLLGVGVNACIPESAASLSAFLQCEGIGDLPIGIDFHAVDFEGVVTYQKRLAALPGKYRSNDACEDGVIFYRRLLSASSEKVDIMEIGYPQILADLLMSAPDEISPLDGCSLVKEKVNKLWMMGGKWDDLENGRENNISNNQRASRGAHILCEMWPTPITFLGFEIGCDVTVGESLPKEDPAALALFDHGSFYGRLAWDPMLVELACTHDEEDAGYRVVRGTASVTPDEGINHFVPDPNGLHCYVIKKYENTYYQEIINRKLLSGARYAAGQVSYDLVLFDLDGTLTDPAEGITNSVAYALQKYGITVENHSTLLPFIGPPLAESFEKFYGFSREEAYRAVDVYREYFADRGIFENKLYPGTVEMLRRLKQAGKTLILATSKPTIFAERILEYFGIKDYFDAVYGSNMDGSRVKKSEVIAAALTDAAVKPGSAAVMVGDREHDVLGAAQNNLDCIGALYGYGGENELCRAGAVFLAEQPEDIADWIKT